MNFIERYRLRKKYSKHHISKALIDEIIASEGTDEGYLSLKDGLVEFVLIAVRGDTPQDISDRIGKITDIASRHHGLVDTVVSTLVAVTYGMFETQEGQDGNRLTLIEELERTLGDDVKIVHGSEHGCFGYLGSETRSSFTFLVPSFVENLGVLATMPYGSTKQV